MECELRAPQTLAQTAPAECAGGSVTGAAQLSWLLGLSAAASRLLKALHLTAGTGTAAPRDVAPPMDAPGRPLRLYQHGHSEHQA